MRALCAGFQPSRADSKSALSIRRLPMRFIALVASALLFASVAVAEDVSQRAPAEPEGMKPLFNGKDLSGWDGDPRLWSIKDGVVKGETTKENPAKGNTFLIWRGG